MSLVRVKFVDFWRGFDPADNAIVALLDEFAEVVLVDDDADYIVYSDFGNEHLEFTGMGTIKIYYTLENLTPNFNQCDYAIGCDHLVFGDRYVRYPLCFWEPRVGHLRWRPPLGASVFERKTTFCNFVYSNGAAAPARDDFFRLLSRYKMVDSAGNHLPNSAKLEDGPARVPFDIQRTNAAKLALMQRSKFTIAFENSAHPGYTTEKITDALSARSVPIYWGNPRVSEDINPAAFIDAGTFRSLDDVVAEVARLDQDDDAYLAMINAAPYSGTAFDDARERFRQFWQNVVGQRMNEARRRPLYGRSRYYEVAKAGATPP